jgi:branched-chain amino acid transport system substrate-binding protein
MSPSNLRRRSVLATGAVAVTLPAIGRRAHAAQPLRIGVLNDQSGVYADLAGPGEVVAARMAVDDLGGKVNGQLVEVIAADHQNKAEIGSGIARKWFDLEHVGMAIGFSNSSVALAVERVAHERGCIAIATAVATVDFTGKNCSPTAAAWLYDSYSLTNSLAHAMVTAGGSTWFFITVDYAFGHSMEADARRAVEASGGKVFGSVLHPLGTADFSSYLLQAKASGAAVIAFANAGGDLINGIKQAQEFHLSEGGQTLAALLLYITDVHSLGLQTAQGLTFVTAFYWDRNEETRAWARRFEAQTRRMPTMAHAATYSATRHYLRAVEAVGGADGIAIMAKMREMPVNDFYVKNGLLRAGGGLLHEMYLMRVKGPQESKQAWDYYSMLAVVPADMAFKPLDLSDCPLVRR